MYGASHRRAPVRSLYSSPYLLISWTYIQDSSVSRFGHPKHLWDVGSQVPKTLLALLERPLRRVALRLMLEVGEGKRQVVCHLIEQPYQFIGEEADFVTVQAQYSNTAPVFAQWQRCHRLHTRRARDFRPRRNSRIGEVIVHDIRLVFAEHRAGIAASLGNLGIHRNPQGRVTMTRGAIDGRASHPTRVRIQEANPNQAEMSKLDGHTTYFGEQRLRLANVNN